MMPKCLQFSLYIFIVIIFEKGYRDIVTIVLPHGR